MKVEVEQTNTCERRLTIEMPVERVQREMNAIYGGLQKRVKIPGFRQGKVPRSILERHYRHSVEQEILQKLIPEALSEAMTKENLEAVGEPQIDHVDLAKDRPFQFVATTQIIPTSSCPITAPGPSPGTSHRLPTSNSIKRCSNCANAMRSCAR